MADRIITGIDIGTHLIKVSIARVLRGDNGPAKPEIIGTGLAESRGLKNGYIIQVSEVTRSVKVAIAQAEKMAGLTVKKAHVGIGSIGLEEIYSHGEIIPARADSEISPSDLEKVMLDSEERIADHIPNRRTLHAIPLRYQIDGVEVLGRPVGLKGTKFEVDGLFVTTFEQHVNDIITAVESAGVIVEDVIASPLASSFVMLTKAQKRAGCILINIGAETTSMVVFEDSTPISLKIFPVGSDNITNDIALGLRIPLEEAEKLKRGAMISATYSKKKLDTIIAERLESIFSLVNVQLKKIKRDALLPAGAILTGGGANTFGIVETAKVVLDLPVRIATLEIGKPNKNRETSWAVAYGLCMWGVSNTEEASAIGLTKNSKNRLLNWLSQFLP